MRSVIVFATALIAAGSAFATQTDNNGLSLNIQALQSPLTNLGLAEAPVTTVGVAIKFDLNLEYTIALSSGNTTGDTTINIDLPDGIQVVGLPSFGAIAGWNASCTQNGATTNGLLSIWKWTCAFENPSLSSSGSSTVSGQVEIPMVVRQWIPASITGSIYQFNGTLTAGSATVQGQASIGVSATTQVYQEVVAQNGSTAWEVNPVTGETGVGFETSVYTYNQGSGQVAPGGVVTFSVPSEAWVEQISYGGFGSPDTVTAQGCVGDPTVPGNCTIPLGPLDASGNFTSWSQPTSVIASSTLGFGNYLDDTGATDTNLFDPASYYIRLWIPCSKLAQYQANDSLNFTFSGTQLQVNPTGTIPVTASGSAVPNLSIDVLGQSCNGGPGPISKHGHESSDPTAEGGRTDWVINANPPQPPVQEVDDVVISDYVKQEGQSFEAWNGEEAGQPGGIIASGPFLTSAGGDFDLYYCNLPNLANPDHMTAADFHAALALPAPSSIPIAATDSYCSQSLSDFTSDPLQNIFVTIPNISHVVLHAARWGRSASAGSTVAVLPEQVMFTVFTHVPAPFAYCNVAGSGLPPDMGYLNNDFWIESAAAGSLYSPALNAADYGLAVCGAGVSLSKLVAFPTTTPGTTNTTIQDSFNKGDHFWYYVDISPQSVVPVTHPIFVDDLPLGQHYVPTSTHFENSLSCSPTPDAIVNPNPEPVVTTSTVDGHDILTWSLAPQQLDDSTGGCSSVVLSPTLDVLTGNTVYWDNYTDFVPYRLRYEVTTDPNYPFVNGATNINCIDVTEDNQSQAIAYFVPGGQQSCSNVFSLVPGEMRASVVPSSACVGATGAFTITGSNTGGTDLTHFTMVAPIPPTTLLASCDLGVSTSANISYQSGGTWNASCPDLTTVTAVQVELDDFQVGAANVVFTLQLALGGAGAINEHVTLSTDTLATITSGSADQPLIPGANCCVPNCNNLSCGDGCGGLCPDSTPCNLNPANVCIPNAACSAGVCGGSPLTCTNGDACHSVGTCDSTSGCPAATLDTGFCFIGDACVAAGQQNPENQCQACDPSTSTSGYTPFSSSPAQAPIIQVANVTIPASGVPTLPALGGATVTLDASGTTAPGEVLGFQWIQVGSTASTYPLTLSPVGTSGSVVTFNAPLQKEDLCGPVTLQFTVTATATTTCGGTAAASETISIIIDEPPVARGKSNTPAVCGGYPFSLDGSGSTDPNGLTLTSFNWTEVDGNGSATFSGEAVTRTAPSVTTPTTLTYVLSVADAFFTSENVDSLSTVSVTVKPENLAPVADAGKNQTVASAANVTLDGTGSYDPDRDALTYSWVQTSGGKVSLSNSHLAQPTFKAPTIGSSNGQGSCDGNQSEQPQTLVFQLTVTDCPTSTQCGGPLSSTSTVAITVEKPDHPPVANTGGAQTVNEGTVVQLDGSASSDPDGDTLTYAWVQVSTGAPGVGTISHANTSKPSFVAPAVAVGTSVVFEFQLTVTDPSGLSSSATVTITDKNPVAPPNCSGAYASQTQLWPPNHEMINVSILGVKDPNDSNVKISITSITQDEPTSGTCHGDTPIDGVINSDGTCLLRAEHGDSSGNRTYHVQFSADDHYGNHCTGQVTVGAPPTNNGKCGDRGGLYDSCQ